MTTAIQKYVPPGLDRIRRRKASGGFTATGLIVQDPAKAAAFQERWGATWHERWELRDVPGLGLRYFQKVKP